jgi:GNAT superfamily N-acetyltransferase
MRDESSTIDAMSSPHPLDNPIWTALQTGHAHLAQGDATLAWYPDDVGPFGGVAADGVPSPDALAYLRSRTEPIHLIGPRPTLPATLAVADHTVLQMTSDRLTPGAGAEPIAMRVLTDADLPAMLDLMARVYPGYFRRRTNVLGQYLGIFHDDRLVAMGGERFLPAACCELSGIATDPSATGRGYARAIIERLVASIRDRGLQPFLHVSPGNTRAIHLYRSLGFVLRAELPILTISPAITSGSRTGSSAH